MLQLHNQNTELKICFTGLTSAIPRTLPAHEEENEGDDADDADDHGDAHKDRGSSEGGRENCSEVVKTSPTYLGPVLAVMLKWSAERLFVQLFARICSFEQLGI